MKGSMTSKFVIAKIGFELMVMVILKATSSHGLAEPFSCVLGTNGKTASAPCEVNVFLGQMFVLDCSDEETVIPSKFTGSEMEACGRAIRDEEDTCDDIQDLSSIITVNGTSKEVGRTRRSEMTDKITVYGACFGVSDQMFVTIYISPFRFYPSYISSTCDGTATRFETGDNDCSAAVFPGETLSIFAPSDLNTLAPALCFTNTGSVCKAPLESDACPEGSDELWKDFLGLSGDPTFIAPEDEQGFSYENDANFSDAYKTGYLLARTATRRRSNRSFMVESTFYTVARPVQITKDVMQCNSGSCEKVINPGDSIVINCTSSESVIPSDLLTKGIFCESALPDTAEECDSPIDVGKLGVRVSFDVYKKYVMLIFNTESDDEFTAYARCVGGPFPYEAKLVFSLTSSSTPSPNTTTSSTTSHSKPLIIKSALSVLSIVVLVLHMI